MHTIQFDPYDYVESKYKLEEHKYTGWYWVSEKRAFMRWQDMMDFYQRNREQEET